MFFFPFSMAIISPLSISSARQMSPCDIPLRVRIFLMLSPSLLLINILVTYKILHFQTILYYNSIYEYGEAKPKISFPFFVGSPHTPRRKSGIRKENFWVCPRPQGADEVRRVRAYDLVQSFHALSACEIGSSKVYD